MIEQHDIDLVLTHQGFDFFELALANEGARRRRHPAADHDIDVLNCRRTDQFDKLAEIVLVALLRQIDVYQQRSFAAAGAFKLEQPTPR